MTTTETTIDKPRRITTLINAGIRIKYGAEKRRCRKNHKNYSKIIKKLTIESKARKLKVAFLVNENAKWSCQSLYEELDKSSAFEPIILVTSVCQSGSKTYENIKQASETYDFFISRKMNAHYAFDIEKERYLDLREFGPDLVFYQQPWDLDLTQSPLVVGKFALCCYVPYSIAGTSEALQSYPRAFLYCLWKHFVISDSIKNEYESWMRANKGSLIVAGHPKLDIYQEKTTNDKHYVIYAPHFAFKNSTLKLSTFDWSGKYILDFAKAHRELNWVFKPHPRLKSQVIEDGIMTEGEINSYYDEWGKIGMVYDQGDYFGVFKNSDAMITDSSSFLSEYLPTKMPVIHLISKDMVTPNSIARVTSAHYYKAHDLKELEFYLVDVIINRNDPMKEKRIADIGILALDGKTSSSRIVDHLRKEFGI